MDEPELLTADPLFLVAEEELLYAPDLELVEEEVVLADDDVRMLLLERATLVAAVLLAVEVPEVTAERVAVPVLPPAAVTPALVVVVLLAVVDPVERPTVAELAIRPPPWLNTLLRETPAP